MSSCVLSYLYNPTSGDVGISLSRERTEKWLAAGWIKLTSYEEFVRLRDNPPAAKGAKVFESLNKLVEAFFAGEFDPVQHKFFIRGAELFILDAEGETVFSRYCGEVVMEICAIFGVEPAEI